MSRSWGVVAFWLLAGCSIGAGSDGVAETLPGDLSTTVTSTSESRVEPTTERTVTALQRDLTEGATFVVAGPFPEGSFAYLDHNGKVLRYGGPTRDTFVDTAWSTVCPDLDTVVGIHDYSIVSIRSASTGEGRDIDLSSDLNGGYIASADCGQNDAQRLWLVVGQPSEDGQSQTHELWEAVDDRARLIAEISDESNTRASVVGDHLLVHRLLYDSETLEIYDPTTGIRTELAQARSGMQYSPAAPHPSEPMTFISEASTSDRKTGSTLLLIDPTSGDLQRFDFPDGESAHATWIDDKHIMLSFAYGFPGEPDVAGPDVQIVRAAGFEEIGHVDEWPGVSTVYANGSLWGVTEGNVVRGNIDTGEVTMIIKLPALTYGPILHLQEP